MKRIWLGWLVASVFLCFIPLTNVLGYESSAIMGIIFALTIPLDNPNSALDLQKSVLELQQNLMASCLPLCILLLNGIRVQNCDLQTGFYFWGLLALTSIGLVSILRFGVAMIFPNIQIGWVYAILGGEFLWFLWKLAWWPSIAGYSWTFGWFAGSIYDEALAVPAELIYARVFHLLTVLMIASICWGWKFRRLNVLNCLAPVLWLSMCTALKPLGLHQSTDFVRQELGGQFQTAHAIVYYSQSHLNAEEVQRLKWDIEFRYWELQQFFDEDPVQWKGRPLEIFVYPNTETQQRLMGSRRTLVARPWTHQMHIRWTFGSSVLAHEMAHLFTSPFGSWPLHLATIYNIIPNIGFVEGVAVAADWPTESYSPDEIASVLFEENMLPDLQSALTPWGFWKQPAGKAYQAMGSFVAWLIRTYGIERFKILYQTFEFYDIYGKSSGELLNEWRLYLGTIDVKNIDKKQILIRYSGKSIFQKQCARTVAEAWRNFEISIQSRHTGQVLQQYEKLIQWRPNDIKIQILYFQYLIDIKEEINVEKIAGLLDTVSLGSDDYYNLQGVRIRAITPQSSTDAMHLLDEILVGELSARWRRHFVMMRFFLLHKLDLGYFSKNFTIIDRLAWLELQSHQPELDYLRARNWFTSAQLEVVNSLPIELNIDADLLKEYHRILYQSALLKTDWPRLKKLNEFGIQPASLEYEQRQQWLMERSEY